MTKKEKRSVSQKPKEFIYVDEIELNSILAQLENGLPSVIHDMQQALSGVTKIDKKDKSNSGSDDFTDVPHGADTAIRIQGDSMEPLIHDGQIIFYHQQEEVENGEIAIVEIDGDGVTCKQIYYDYTSDEVILRSINKKYEPRHVKDDQVRIIGRVIL